MSRPNLRVLSTLVIIIGALVALALFAGLTERLLDLQVRLRAQPAWLAWIVYGVAAAIISGFAYLLTRLYWGGPQKAKSALVLDEDALRERVASAEAGGIETAAVHRALSARDQGADSLTFAVFGEVSAGKSTIIKALVPNAQVVTSPLAGSTQACESYRWKTPEGWTVTLTDMPGIGHSDTIDKEVMDEALTAHLVVYVCDQDLTASDTAALQRLIRLDKPLVIVLNKADQYADPELAALLSAIHERLLAMDPDHTVTVVPVIGGGEERVIEVRTGGDEVETTRVRAADVSQLLVTLNHLVRSESSMLHQRRDQSLFVLAVEELEQAERQFRERRGEEIVRSHTRKAVLGAMAAISPGSDIVIQGYLGHSLVKALTELYGQRMADVEIDRLLDLSQSRVGRSVPVALAIAGNGLKAFPGLGTVSGGALHAVAYGLIFDAVGRSLALNLEERRELDAKRVAKQAAAILDSPLDARVRRLARLALSVDRADGE